MLFHEIVNTSARVSSVSGRRDKIELLAALFKRTDPEDIKLAVAYLSGTLPQGRIGIGWAAVRDSKPEHAASEPTMTVRDVDSAFTQIASTQGPGSAGEKVQRLRELQYLATDDEQRFLAQLILGELRQGALEGLLVGAVAHAAGIPGTEVRRATMLSGDLGDVARAVFVGGREALFKVALQLFRPVQPMLAQSANAVDEALDRLGEAALEYKMDGARIQAHKGDDEVRVFSRNLRDVTKAVPEVVEAIRKLPARELILDGEVLAFDERGAPHPFQVTMRRFGRKLEVASARRELPLTPFFFDVLQADGVTMIDQPQSQRFDVLENVAGDDLVMPHTVTGDPTRAASFLTDARRRGHEGVMVKALDAAYSAGGRGHAWLKVKPVHTLDLVVLAAEWGHGRRRGKLSNIHLGARDDNAGGFVMLGKTFKGMTDQMLTWQTEKFLSIEIGRDKYTVYVRPEVVVEVAFNDVQASPQYPGGVALRFARVKRYRTDKSAAEADTITSVRKLYQPTN